MQKQKEMHSVLVNCFFAIVSMHDSSSDFGWIITHLQGFTNTNLLRFSVHIKILKLQSEIPFFLLDSSWIDPWSQYFSCHRYTILIYYFVGNSFDEQNIHSMFLVPFDLKISDLLREFHKLYLLFNYWTIQLWIVASLLRYFLYLMPFLVPIYLFLWRPSLFIYRASFRNCVVVIKRRWESSENANMRI